MSSPFVSSQWSLVVVQSRCSQMGWLCPRCLPLGGPATISTERLQNCCYLCWWSASFYQWTVPSFISLNRTSLSWYLSSRLRPRASLVHHGGLCHEWFSPHRFSQRRKDRTICRDWSGNSGRASSIWVNGPSKNVENRSSYQAWRWGVKMAKCLMKW